jgi:hypothetical protein
LNRTFCKIRKEKKFPYKNDVVPEEKKYAERGVKFQQYNLGSDNIKRFMVFTTTSNLIHLTNSEIWVVYGIFKIETDEFTQFMTIQVFKYSIYVALVIIQYGKKILNLIKVLLKY